MVKTFHFGFDVSKHRVIRVAGKTGMIGIHAMILEMLRGYVFAVINMEAFAVRLHFVAGKTKLRGLRMLDMGMGSHQGGENRENE